MGNELLSLAYSDVDAKKAERLKNCAPKLWFQADEDGKKLRRAFFCRVRLCPMCTWRRALKAGGQMRKVMDAIKEKEDKPKAYIMLTLTMRNVAGGELGSALTEILVAFSNLTKTKEFKSILGYFRGLEVTHNVDNKSENYDTYHPHLHCILCVKPSYFTSRDYISQARWTELWKRSLKADYTPIIDVRKVKGDTAAAVAEVAKYTVKSGDYIIPYDWDLTIDAVKTLDKALHNRRFIGMGGIIKHYHKILNLDDVDKGDLVHMDPDAAVDTAKEDESRLVCYAWYSGYRKYIKQ